MIMKKTYIKPATLLTKVGMDKMILTVSDPNVTLNSGGSVNAANVESRRGGLWDEDEDE